MLRTSACRTISAPLEEIWALIADPHHLPRWWPRVTRVEGVDADGFTEVFATSRGRVVRADFELLDADAVHHSLRWSQRVEGTPFERVLKHAETELRLQPVDGTAAADPATEVTIELRQSLRGLRLWLGSLMLRRAARATLQEALAGLERIVG